MRASVKHPEWKSRNYIIRYNFKIYINTALHVRHGFKNIHSPHCDRPPRGGLLINEVFVFYFIITFFLYNYYHSFSAVCILACAYTYIRRAERFSSKTSWQRRVPCSHQPYLCDLPSASDIVYAKIPCNYGHITQ